MFNRTRRALHPDGTRVGHNLTEPGRVTDDVMLEVLGCGDAFGSGGRFQTCFLLHDAAGTMAIDFGATSLVALRAAGQDPHQIGLILLSHFHGDHMGGLPFFLLDREYSARVSAPLCIAGPPGLRARLRAVTDCLFPDAWRDTWRFPLDLVEIEPDCPVVLGGRRIRTTEVRHPTGSHPATAIRVETGGKVLAYSGDTVWTGALSDIARGSDLFICDCFDLTDQPKSGHLSLPVLLEKLPQIEARRIVLTHLGPEMLAERDSLPLDSLADGAKLIL